MAKFRRRVPTRKKKTTSTAVSVKRKSQTAATRKSTTVSSQKKRAEALRVESLRVVRSRAAEKGWETRRARARAKEKARRARARVRRRIQEEKAAKEARRLAKWRKSYRKYLEFRVPKKEREKLEIPARKELVCRVLFDADEMDEREEHIWTNFELLMGHSVNRVLAGIPGETGEVRVMFRLIEGAEFERMQAGRMEEMEEGDYGVLIQSEWEFDVEPRLFWSNYYANARTLLPARPEKGGQDYKASWLGVVKLELCYAPGEAKE